MSNQTEKKQTSMNVNKDILIFCKENKINLSEWVNVEFYKKFFSIDAKLKRLSEIESEKVQIKKEIKHIQTRKEAISKQMTQNEIRYVSTAKSKLRTGCDINSMKNYFNTEYGRNLNIDEFKSLIEFHEDQMERRTSYAIGKINSKKKR